MIQYRLSTLLLVFMVVLASLGVFGGWGLLVAAILVAVAAYARAGSVNGVLSRAIMFLGPLFLLSCCLPPILVGPLVDGKRMMCRGNLYQIGRAMSMYENSHGSMPPPVIADKQGKPLHSCARPFCHSSENRRQLHTASTSPGMVQTMPS